MPKQFRHLISEHLLDPLTELFGLIYNHNQLPEQWLIAKTIPLHKKGSKQDIENYRPIANLCSCTKIFEKLILKRICSFKSKSIQYCLPMPEFD